MSAERQKELETLQEVIISLTLRLRERNKQFEALRQHLKGSWILVSSDYMTFTLILAFVPKACKPVPNQGLEVTQTISSQDDSTYETTGNK